MSSLRVEAVLSLLLKDSFTTVKTYIKFPWLSDNYLGIISFCMDYLGEPSGHPRKKPENHP